MAITFVGTPALVTAINGADITATLNTVIGGTLQQNDVVVVAGWAPERAGSEATTTSTGWTAQAAKISNTNIASQCWLKRMSASPDTTFVFRGTGNASDGTTLLVYAMRGVDTTTANDATTTTVTTGNSTDPNPAAITTVTAGALVIAFAGSQNNDAAIVVPSGYSSLVTGVAVDTLPITAAGAHKFVSPAGAEDPGVFGSWITGRWTSYTVALRPAPTAAPASGFQAGETELRMVPHFLAAATTTFHPAWAPQVFVVAGVSTPTQLGFHGQFQQPPRWGRINPAAALQAWYAQREPAPPTGSDLGFRTDFPIPFHWGRVFPAVTIPSYPAQRLPDPPVAVDMWASAFSLPQWPRSKVARLEGFTRGIADYRPLPTGWQKPWDNFGIARSRVPFLQGFTIGQQEIIVLGSPISHEGLFLGGTFASPAFGETLQGQQQVQTPTQLGFLSAFQWPLWQKQGAVLATLAWDPQPPIFGTATPATLGWLTPFTFAPRPDRQPAVATFTPWAFGSVATPVAPNFGWYEPFPQAYRRLRGDPNDFSFRQAINVPVLFAPLNARTYVVWLA